MVPIAIGLSNGAIVAAALLLTRLRLLAGAVLFRPLSPFTNDHFHLLKARQGGSIHLVRSVQPEGRTATGGAIFGAD
jgi:predicted esterase